MRRRFDFGRLVRRVLTSTARLHLIASTKSQIEERLVLTSDQKEALESTLDWTTSRSRLISFMPYEMARESGDKMAYMR